jgi:hypothetical protein
MQLLDLITLISSDIIVEHEEDEVKTSIEKWKNVFAGYVEFKGPNICQDETRMKTNYQTNSIELAYHCKFFKLVDADCIESDVIELIRLYLTQVNPMTTPDHFVQQVSFLKS